MSIKSLTYGDLETVVVEHEGGIRAAQFVVVSFREFGCFNRGHISYLII